MTKPYSLDIRERVTEWVAAGDSVRAVARLGRASLTRGNVNGSHTPGNNTRRPDCVAEGPGFEPGLTACSP